jgi:hypothetical protein
MPQYFWQKHMPSKLVSTEKNMDTSYTNIKKCYTPPDNAAEISAPDHYRINPYVCEGNETAGQVAT